MVYGKYKTVECWHFKKHHTCKFGTRCCFAHGTNDIRRNGVLEKELHLKSLELFHLIDNY